MTLIELEMKLEVEPNFLKRMKWQAQVLLVKELLEQIPMDKVIKLLGLSPRWINDANRVVDYWGIAKHAPSFQQATITANTRRAQERRTRMEKIASEATSSPRTILS